MGQQGFGPDDRAARFMGQTVAAGADGFLAVPGPQRHMALTGQNGFINVGVGHGERPRSHDPVPTGFAGTVETGEGKRHHRVVQQGQQPAHRSSEGTFPAHPLHFFGKRKRRQYPHAGFGQNIRRGPAAHGLSHGQIGALVRLLHIDLGEIHILRPGEPQSGLGGPTFGVKGDACRRSGHHHFLRSLRPGQPGDVHRQPSGSGRGANPAEIQPGLAEKIRKFFFQLPVQTVQKPGRHLLHAYFKNKMIHIRFFHVTCTADDAWPRAVPRTAGPRPRPERAHGRCIWPVR